MIRIIKLKTNQIKQRIIGNEHNKELLIGSSIAFFIRICATLAVFLMNIFVARYLGVYESGKFFLALAIITILGVVVRIGGDNVILRYVGIYAVEKQWGKIKKILRFFNIRTALTAILITILLVIFRDFISEKIFNNVTLNVTLGWMLFSVPFLGLYTLYAMGMQGVGRVLMSVAVQNIFVPVFLILFIVVFSPHTAASLSRLYLISSGLTFLLTVICWRFFMPQKSGITVKFDVEKDPSKKQLIKSAGSNWAILVMQQALLWGGQFLSGMYGDPKQIAQLAIAQRTSMLISFILVAVNLVSAPRFASLYKQRKMNELKKYTQNSTMLMIFFALPIVLFILVFPGVIMSLFGKGFIEGIWMLRILAIGQFVNVITGSVNYLLTMSGFEKDVRNITFVVGILSVMITFFFVRLYGALGASIAIAISVSAQNLSLVWMVKKRIGFTTMKIW
ncbi:MAG TPA: MATE family efflux transporter [Chitinophagaceae bacterium]|nr:MATE family efflux transporter [Chitinophagaceae bacterium]